MRRMGRPTRHRSAPSGRAHCPIAPRLLNAQGDYRDAPLEVHFNLERVRHDAVAHRARSLPHGAPDDLLPKRSRPHLEVNLLSHVRPHQ